MLLFSVREKKAKNLFDSSLCSGLCYSIFCRSVRGKWRIKGGS